MDDQSQQWISSGVPGLDQVVGGGLPARRVHVLKGAPGSGKTVLASQLCFHSVAGGSRVLYVTLLTELHDTLMSNLSSFTFFDPGVVGRELKYLSLTGAFRDAGFEGLMRDLRAEVRHNGPAVVVLDGFFPVVATATSPLPMSMFLQDLEALVSLAGSTVLLTDSTPAGVDAPVHQLVDGIIELQQALYGVRARRWLQVCKLRGTRHLEGVHRFCIDNDGLRVTAGPQAPVQDGTPAPPGAVSEGP